MSSSTGIVLNNTTVVTNHGCKIHHASGLAKGTKIWIHYKDDGSILCVEKYKEEDEVQAEYLGYSGTGL